MTVFSGVEKTTTKTCRVCGEPLARHEFVRYKWTEFYDSQPDAIMRCPSGVGAVEVPWEDIPRQDEMEVI